MTNETKKEVDIAEFKSLVESYHKILGLDIGSKRIGVAISTSDMTCLLYTSPSPRDRSSSRMPSSA